MRGRQRQGACAKLSKSEAQIFKDRDDWPKGEMIIIIIREFETLVGKIPLAFWKKEII